MGVWQIVGQNNVPNPPAPVAFVPAPAPDIPGWAGDANDGGALWWDYDDAGQAGATRNGGGQGRVVRIPTPIPAGWASFERSNWGILARRGVELRVLLGVICLLVFAFSVGPYGTASARPFRGSTQIYVILCQTSDSGAAPQTSWTAPKTG